jgi:hypothetical protein
MGKAERFGGLREVGARPKAPASQDWRRRGDVAAADDLRQSGLGGAEQGGGGAGGQRERRENTSVVGVHTPWER